MISHFIPKNAGVNSFCFYTTALFRVIFRILRFDVFIIGILLVFFLQINFKINAETYYAKTDNVKVFAAANAQSNVIKSLKKNESVDSLSKSGKFVNVRTADKKIGWVFEFNLTLSQPNKTKSNTFLDSLTTDNYASRESSTAANVRGLSEMSKQYAQQKKISKKSVDTVTKMEQFKITAEELDKFLKAGKLGEYAE